MYFGAADYYFPELEWFAFHRKAGERSQFKIGHYRDFVGYYKNIIRFTESQGSVLRNAFLRSALCAKSNQAYGKVETQFVHQLEGVWFVVYFVGMGQQGDKRNEIWVVGGEQIASCTSSSTGRCRTTAACAPTC